MYSVAVKRDFVAQHFLFGGDWGDENILHSHHYAVELILEGKQLDKHGYLIDIVDIEFTLDSIVKRYKDKTLNDFEEFNGLNPSIEHFSRIICTSISEKINLKMLSSISIKLWENEIAWSNYKLELNN